MGKGKMRSFRFTDKMQHELQHTSYVWGVPMTQVLAKLIEEAYKKALKEEKKA